MIRRKKHPEAWAEQVQHLADAKEHLDELLSEIQEESYAEEDFAVDLGHVYAHLNRVWNSRDFAGGLSEDDWDETTQYPNDLVLVG